MARQHEADVIVIGGGPAGLSASVYLARYGRSVALFDLGHGRSTHHQVSLVNLIDVTVRYQGDVVREAAHLHGFSGCRIGVSRHHDLLATIFIAVAGDAPEHGDSHVLLPAVELRIVVEYSHAEDDCLRLGFSELPTGDETVLGLLHALDLVVLGPNMVICQELLKPTLAKLNRLTALETEEGIEIPVEAFFVVQGATPETGLARMRGVELAENGYILVDTEQKTSVEGVYAAGDITQLHSHRVSAAVHEGAQAASAANYFLYPPELKAN
jgi:thioredoxin reductase (NADPH)